MEIPWLKACAEESLKAAMRMKPDILFIASSIGRNLALHISPSIPWTHHQPLGKKKLSYCPTTQIHPEIIAVSWQFSARRKFSNDELLNTVNSLRKKLSEQEKLRCMRKLAAEKILDAFGSVSSTFSHSLPCAKEVKGIRNSRQFPHAPQFFSRPTDYIRFCRLSGFRSEPIVHELQPVLVEQPQLAAGSIRGLPGAC
jgi:hypothetical protein